MAETKADPRSAPMAELYRSGKSLREIGELFGLTRERVRQLISKDFGINRTGGGAHITALNKKADKVERQEARCQRLYGCSVEQRIHLANIGATRKFRSHRGGAASRGIPFEFNLWQWWMVWQQSGKWESRGKGQGYSMCRKGDVGPYAAGNVFIGLSTNNSSEARRKNSDLPVGVRKNKRCAGYSSARQIGGIKYWLGSFPNPGLARAAYLAIGESHGIIHRERE